MTGRRLVQLFWLVACLALVVILAVICGLAWWAGGRPN